LVKVYACKKWVLKMKSELFGNGGLVKLKGVKTCEKED